jgi:gas vesicle protein
MIYGIFLAGVLLGMVIGFSATVRLLAGTAPKDYAAKVENVKFPVHGRRRVR